MREWSREFLNAAAVGLASRDQETYPGPAISEATYEWKVQRMAGSCQCGRSFTFRTKPRCPKCRSTRQADPAKLGDPKRAPEAFVREWVSHAREIHQARAVAADDREEADPEFDELISRFRLDPAAVS